MKHIVYAVAIFLVQFDLAWALCGGSSYYWSLGNFEKFPCNQYFKVCRKHEEGREGKLMLPIQQEMTPPLLDIFDYGDINITFSEPVSALDVPEGAHGQRISRENQQFTLFIKDVYRSRMEGRKLGSNYAVEMLFRSPILKPGYTGGKSLGIVSLAFGNFRCPEPPKQPAKTAPKCRLEMLDETITDGYRAFAVFDVPSKSNVWESEMVFPVPIRNFDSPTGDVTRIGDNSFKISHRRHNSKVMKGQEFKIEFTVHVEDRANTKPSKRVATMTFNEFSCSGVVIRRKLWN